MGPGAGLELRPGRGSWGGPQRGRAGLGSAERRRGSGDRRGGNGPQRCSPGGSGVGAWAHGRGVSPLFLAPPVPQHSPLAELSLVVPRGPGPSVGGGYRPVPPPGTAVAEAAGEAQAESGGL